MDSQTRSYYKVKLSRLVNGQMMLGEEQVSPEELDKFKEEVERAGGIIHRSDLVTVKATQLTCKEARINEMHHEFQVVDFGGEFVLRHFIGNQNPIIVELGVDTVTATEKYNEYLKDRCYDESLFVDDLALYCGHSYAYQAG